MKTKLITGLAIAVFLLLGGQAFAQGGRTFGARSFAVATRAPYRGYSNAAYVATPYYNDYGYSYYAPYAYDDVTPPETNDAQVLYQQVQSVLYQLGYYRGPINGVLTARTQSAIGQYQRAHRLPDTGQIDGNLITLMGVH